MKKWAFLLSAAAMVVIGCGGGGGGGTGTNGGTGGNDLAVNPNELNKPALLNVAYLTGQGRAQGDVTVVLRRVSFRDSFGTVETTLLAERYMLLNGFTHQVISLDADTTNSRVFSEFDLEIKELRVDDGSGGFQTITGPANQPVVFDSFDADVRVFPGRHTTVQIYLDDAIINVDSNNNATFDRDLFIEKNYDPDTGRIESFLSDYVRFDISAVARRPQLSGGTLAANVMMSGDATALASAVPPQGQSGIFEVLTPTGFIEGRFVDESVLQGQPTPGTYNLLQPDPRDLTGLTKITSLLGIWRPYTRVFVNLGTFAMISFPNSEDDEEQDVAMFTRNAAGQITEFYFGFLNLTNGTFSVFPIDQIVGGGTGGEIVGTIGAYLDRSGSATTSPSLIRSGQFTIDAGNSVGPIPAGFQSSGRFVVFRG